MYVNYVTSCTWPFTFFVYDYVEECRELVSSEIIE